MDGAGTALVAVKDITRSFRMGQETVQALAGVSLEIATGEFVAVMGPSGSGKSTFMNVIGCLDRPTSGVYRLAGEEVSRLSATALAGVRNRRIGFVFQQFNLLQRADALANVELPMVYAGIAGAERHRRARAALARVGLADRATHRPMELSGGQQQRVAIARALVNEPAMLLADEPTGALDSRTSLGIIALFRALNAQGMTVIIVTHEEEVARFADRVIRFRDGKVTTDGRQEPADVVAEQSRLQGVA
ncbi:MAG: ABC transporter ATP-binding protein [Proteobacteria bacterium]|nr:ABC transporter ATP-binding protein [Pseudomonadota bacterium]